MYHHKGLLLFCCLVSIALCQDYQEVDSRPPQSRLRTARGPIIPNRAPNKQAATPKTSTTAEPQPEYEDVVYEDEEDGAAVTTTTSTEAPKKGIRGGVVRPFRSNTDLIEALKRRRAQASSGTNGNGYSNGASTTTTTSTEQPQKSNRKSKSSERKFSRGGDRGQQQTSTEPPTEEPQQKSRLFAGRGRRF